MPSFYSKLGPPPWRRELLALAVYAALGALVFHPVSQLGFLPDDGWLLYHCRGKWFTDNIDMTHYMALPLAIVYGLFKIFQTNPLPYHLFHLFWAVITAWLVKIFAARLGLASWQGWAAGLLVLFNSVAAEAYLWFGVFKTVIMAAMLVLALLWLMRFREGGGKAWAAGYLGLVFLAPFMEAKGVIIPILGLVLDRYPSGLPGTGNRRRAWVSKEDLIHFLALGIVGGVMIFRWTMGIISYTYTARLPWKIKWHTFKVTLVSTFFHGLDDRLSEIFIGFPAFLKSLPTLFWLSLLAILVLGLGLGRGLERRRLGLFLIFWVLSVLPHTFGGILQFRYFYLPGVFSALVIVELLEIIRRRWPRPKLGLVPVVLVLAIYLAADLRGFQLAFRSWQEASDIFEAGIKKIKAKLPVLPADTRLVLVDFPFYIHNRQNVGAPYAGYTPYVLVFSYTFKDHLKLLYRTDKIQVAFFSLPATGKRDYSPLGTLVSPEKLAGILDKPHTETFWFISRRPPRFSTSAPP